LWKGLRVHVPEGERKRGAVTQGDATNDFQGPGKLSGTLR